jgi:hypothetical protein
LIVSAIPSWHWPGITIVYSVTVVNLSTAALADVALLAALPETLTPDIMLTETEATWQGNTLQARCAILPSGASWGVAFRVDVSKQVHPWAIVISRVSVSVGDALQATTSPAIVVPPSRRFHRLYREEE